MGWNHRIVHTNPGDENPWFEVKEVYYNSDGSIAGFTDPCLGSEYPEQIIAVLQRMIDDLKRNHEPITAKDVVGFKEEDHVPF